MRGFWRMWTVAAGSASAFYWTLNAAQAQAPTPNLPNVPEVYKFDSGWPKPLPNNWVMGTVTGMSVDQDDRIWVLDRSGNTPAGKTAAPAVLEFDTDGNLLRSWGTPASVPSGVWPRQVHTIFVDREHNVWLAGAAPGDTLLKFTPDGRFLRDFGNRGPIVERQGMTQDNQSKILMLGVSSAALDEDANEIYIADGYLNRRVIVFDLKAGAFKRGWGAYGKPLSEISNDPQPAHDPNDLHAADFKSPVHCVRISNDGLVYVCDRAGDRIQVFTKQGKFLKEFHVANATMGGGSVGSVDFSSDPAQKYIFVADLVNATVWQLDRQSGEILGHVSHKGTHSGELFAPHVAAMDSKGSVYVGEIGQGSRAQKFVPTAAN
jgi:DNA-binding beta-propeller fold protein YncE